MSQEPYRLMIIDDDVSLLKSIEPLLIKEGYIVSLAKSGRQAISALSKGMTPDLILLDIAMPEMNGYETFNKIKAIQNVPIIFLTSMEDINAELKGLQLGAIDYITKPFVMDILLARVKNHLASIRKMKQEEIENNKNSISFDDKKLKVLEGELTDTEFKVAKMIALGYTNQEIAEQLSYSYTYIKKLAYRIFDKLDINKRNELRQFLV
ncbi:MAG: response regulator [Lachnospiraceae bacterium]|nr:response regulator [Lachnospiraceae bacterium]